jgi:hypothetical protein
MWLYQVSHDQLLFRSPRGSNAGTRIDVLCSGVTALCVPACIDELVVEEVDPSSVPGLTSVTNARLRLGNSVYRITGSRDVSGFVVCEHVAVHEDEREAHEPSALMNLPYGDTPAPGGRE